MKRKNVLPPVTDTGDHMNEWYKKKKRGIVQRAEKGIEKINHFGEKKTQRTQRVDFF